MMEKLKVDKSAADETQRVVAVEEAEATKQEQEARQLAAEVINHFILHFLFDSY